jgi:hypothetical protein
MTSRLPVSENSLAIAMIELDRLERERQDIENHRTELRATVRRQALDIRELDRKLRSAWPRAIARQRRRAGIEHQRSCERQRQMVSQVEREHAERLANLANENAERRAALARLEREVIAEFHPARAALVWLTPFAAAGLVAALGFMMIQQQAPDSADVTHEPATPLAAMAEPSSEPSEDAPPVVSDAIAPIAPIAPTMDEADTIAPTIEPESVSKPSKKPSKKPASSDPIAKPHSKPIVLSDDDDPLGNL